LPPNATIDDCFCRTGQCGNVTIATVFIPEGTQVTTNYVHLHMGTYLRRERLKENWYFDCVCERCADPSELGTFLDAVKCRECNMGHLLPVNPLNVRSEWACDKCKGSESDVKPKATVKRLLDEKDALDRSDLSAYLAFLKKAEKELHPQHYVLTATRRWIIPLYCRRMKANANEKVTDKMLKNKVRMCKAYLDVLGVVEAGFTKNRGKSSKQVLSYGHCTNLYHPFSFLIGRILYEMSDSLVTLQNRR